jgi:LuxR family maltose regulon positive regulatory protein
LRCLATLAAAKTARLLGDEGSARDLLAQARLIYVEPDASVRHVFDEEAVAQALEFDPAAVSCLLGALDDDRIETWVLRVRLALLERDDRAASDLLAAMPPPTTRRARVERSVQLALTVLERDVELANHHLHEALVLGQPERLIRAVVDQGPFVHKLLLSYPPENGEEQYVEDLLAVTSNMLAPVRARKAQTLVEPLSAREVTVLRYLCSRLTYREIAAALYVSLNTLKSHVRSVYRKLGVESRADAVEAGRRSGLI